MAYTRRLNRSTTMGRLKVECESVSRRFCHAQPDSILAHERLKKKAASPALQIIWYFSILCMPSFRPPGEKMAYKCEHGLRSPIQKSSGAVRTVRSHKPAQFSSEISRQLHWPQLDRVGGHAALGADQRDCAACQRPVGVL